MKKITLFCAALVVASSVFGQIQRKWNGQQLIQDWDLATANWLDPSFGFPIPKTFSEDGKTTTAFFDDSSAEGSDTIKVNGVITVDGINVNATKTYVLRRTADTDKLTGTGTLIKEGSGDFVMDVMSDLTGGTIVRAGRVTMEKQTSPNVFGAKLVLDGGIANFATSTSSKYPSITLPVEVSQGKTGELELSRYSYFSSPISGSGDLHLYAGGERTYLGQKNVQPDWSAFTGNVKVDKYIMADVKPGFHGLILNTNRTFKDSLDGFGIDSTFYNRTLTLGVGVTIGTESGTRTYAIGEVQSEDSTSLLGGYYKDSTGPKIAFMLGGLNTNVNYPGRIGYLGAKAYNQLGVIKIGNGTYTLTNNDNKITSGITVRQGRVLVCDNNLRGSKTGGVGGGVSVNPNAILGGTGRISGNVDVYGTLQPGVDGIGTLTLSDSISANPLSAYGTPFKYSFSYINSSNKAASYSFTNGGNNLVNMTLREGSVTEFEIGSVTSYDKVKLTGKVRFSKDSVSAGKPKLKIKLTTSSTIQNGDQFEIISARAMDDLSDGFDIEYPTLQGVTWTVEEKTDTTYLPKEEIRFENHVVTSTNTDSLAVTIVVPDTIVYSYKVVVTAHGNGSGIQSNVANNSISMYPNPTVGEVNFKSTVSEIQSIEIVNAQGQIVLKEETNAMQTKVSLASLPTGVYYAKVKTGKETKVHKLLLK